MMSEISIQAEKIFSFGNFPVTNSFIMALAVLIVLAFVDILLNKRLTVIPYKLQSISEIVLEGIMNFMDTILGNRKTTELYLPLVGTIFFFILSHIKKCMHYLIMS